MSYRALCDISRTLRRIEARLSPDAEAPDPPELPEIESLPFTEIVEDMLHLTIADIEARQRNPLLAR